MRTISDIEVFSSLKQLVIYIVILILYIVIQFYYINKTKLHFLNCLLLCIPTIIWFIILINSLNITGFLIYDGIAYTSVFTAMVVVLFYNFYKIITQSKKLDYYFRRL